MEYTILPNEKHKPRPVEDSTSCSQLFWFQRWCEENPELHVSPRIPVQGSRLQVCLSGQYFCTGASRLQQEQFSGLTDALASFLNVNKLWEESIQLRLLDSEGLCLIAFRSAENARKFLELKQVSLVDIMSSFSRSKPTETSAMLYQLPLDV